MKKKTINTRRKLSLAFKKKILREVKTRTTSIESIAEKHGIHPNLIYAWKKKFETKAEQGHRRVWTDSEKQAILDAIASGKYTMTAIADKKGLKLSQIRLWKRKAQLKAKRSKVQPKMPVSVKQPQKKSKVQPKMLIAVQQPQKAETAKLDLLKSIEQLLKVLKG